MNPSGGSGAGGADQDGENGAGSAGAASKRVIDRLREAGISPARIDAHFAAGLIRLDGQTVTDLEQPAPDGTRPTIWPS